MAHAIAAATALKSSLSITAGGKGAEIRPKWCFSQDENATSIRHLNPDVMGNRLGEAKYWPQPACTRGNAAYSGYPAWELKVPSNGVYRVTTFHNPDTRSGAAFKTGNIQGCSVENTRCTENRGRAKGSMGQKNSANLNVVVTEVTDGHLTLSGTTPMRGPYKKVITDYIGCIFNW